MLEKHFKVVSLLEKLIDILMFEGFNQATFYIASGFVLNMNSYDSKSESHSTISLYRSSNLQVVYSLRITEFNISTSTFCYINVPTSTSTTCNLQNCNDITVLDSLPMHSNTYKLSFDNINLNSNVDEQTFQYSTIYDDAVLIPFMLLSHMKVHSNPNLSDISLNLDDMSEGDLERIIYDLEIKIEEYL